MIRKLKLKVVFLAMSSLLVLLASIVIGMNLINYNSVVEEADVVLSILAQNQGKFPDSSFKPGWDRPPISRRKHRSNPVIFRWCWILIIR